MRRVFFHIHIWKTGGTSFLNICSANFEKNFRRDIMLIQHWFLSNQQLRWLLDYHDWIRCYSCHMLSGDLPYDVEGTEVIGIAFVRNPVDRFVSSYNFQKGDNYCGGIAKDNTFESFYTKALVDTFNPMWRNGQTFVLGGSGTEAGLTGISQLVQNGRLVLLPTERFDESCILLERLFPDDFRDCSYTRYNVSKVREPISEHHRAVISKYMDIDFKLLTLANEYLNSGLERLFPDLNERQRYLEAFRRRCDLKKRRQRFASKVGSIDRAIKTVLRKIIKLA